MTDITSGGRFDPRFNPAFQPGYDPSGAAPAPTTIYGTDDAENLIGTVADDTIFAYGGDDFVAVVNPDIAEQVDMSQPQSLPDVNAVASKRRLREISPQPGTVQFPATLT